MREISQAELAQSIQQLGQGVILDPAQQHQREMEQQMLAAIEHQRTREAELRSYRERELQLLTEISSRIDNTNDLLVELIREIQAV